MSENTKNGGQQPIVENKTESIFVEYKVYDKLEKIDDTFYYRLCELYDEDDHKTLFIDISKIVLAPNLTISISSDNLKSGDILNIEVFDEDTCLRLIEVHDECLYKTREFEILFPEEVKKLNFLYSGTVMKKMDNSFDSYASFHISREDDPNVYEVKLDTKIIIQSIDRTFKKIYVSSDDLLNGFTLKNLKINPYSLFDCDHGTSYNKPVLYSQYSDRDNILSSKDKWLFKREGWFNSFNETVYSIMFYGFIVFALVNIITTSTYFIFDWSMLILILPPLFLFLAQFGKRPINISEVYSKEQIEPNRFWNISRSILGLIIVFYFYYLYSIAYSLDSKYVYDSKDKSFLKTNKVIVGSDLVFRKDKILERYKLVKNKYMINLVYQTPGSLLSFSNKYIDLEINFEFKKGDYLLGDNLDNSLSVIRNSIQKKVSSGGYGNLSSMNTYDYRRAIINIEEDVMNLVSLAIGEDESVIEKIEILTKYAKLHNVK